MSSRRERPSSAVRVQEILRFVREAEEELADLTGGQLDAIADLDGMIHLTSEAQQHLLSTEKAQRTLVFALQGTLDALPAHVALLDHRGRILAVNKAWRRFGDENGHQGTHGGLGESYLEVCDRAQGYASEDARPVASGIRDVLDGTLPQFSLEYACHAPAERRWFQVIVSPLDLDGTSRGAVVMHVDITARMLGEHAVRASAARLRAILDAEAECVQVVSPEGLLLEMNASGLRMIEADSAEQVLGRSVFPLIHHEDRAAFEELHRSVASGDTRRLQYRLVGLQGNARWMETQSVPLTPEEGLPASVLSVTRDITEQRRAEERAEALQRQTSLILRSVGEGIQGLNADGHILFENPAALSMLGWTEHELVGRDAHTAVHHHHSDGRPYAREDCPIQKTLRDGLVRRVDDEIFFRKDGSSFPVEYVCSPMVEPTGAIAGAVLSFRDVSERKRAEQRLLEQAALLDKATDAILVRDLEGHIIYWSRGAESLYGWRSEEVVGKHVRTLQFANRKADFTQANDEVIARGEWNGELEHVCKDGRPILVEGRWTLVCDAQGKPSSVLAINTNITERKRLEQQVLRVQRLESIGTLAGGLAHDLNNVLTPILFSADILRYEEQDPARLKDIDIIEASAKRGAAMVKQVLSFARGTEPKQAPTDLLDLVGETKDVIADTFPKNITVCVRSVSDLWVVSADATQLSQVLMNLCVNARDAMPHGGRLEIALENVVLDDSCAGMNPKAKPGRYVRISVEDTGTGMPAHVMERAFEPFFTTKEVGRGTGLGLSTSHAIVVGHGGFIHIESEPDRGTKFRVYLPAMVSGTEVRPAPAPQMPLPLGHGELVLVIDDEVAIRMLVQRSLQRFGYRVLLAANGAEGVAAYRRHQGEVAVVLTDMAMPVMDGPATIAALSSMSPEVRIICSSGFERQVDAPEPVPSAVRAFVAKPYTAQALLIALHEALAD